MKWILVVTLSLAVLLTACGGNPEDPVDSGGTPPLTTAPKEVPVDASPFFVDSTDILLMESFPVQVALRVIGSLPTPCHQAVWEVDDDGETIHVTLGSVAEGDIACVQVLEPAELSIPLGSFESGSRIVTVNGEEVGTFEV